MTLTPSNSSSTPTLTKVWKCIMNLSWCPPFFILDFYFRISLFSFISLFYLCFFLLKFKCLESRFLRVFIAHKLKRSCSVPTRNTINRCNNRQVTMNASFVWHHRQLLHSAFLVEFEGSDLDSFVCAHTFFIFFINECCFLFINDVS